MVMTLESVADDYSQDGFVFPIDVVSEARRPKYKPIWKKPSLN